MTRVRGLRPSSGVHLPDEGEDGLKALFRFRAVVAVMHLGKIVEYGETEDVFTNPQDPYTKALLSAIPIPDPKVERTRERLVYKDGELVSASSLTRRG